MSSRVAIASVCTTALVAVATASAAGGNREQVRLTAADNTYARTVVIHRSDLAAGWKGGLIKPDLSSSQPCPNFNPKQSDLVITGAAETDFQTVSGEIDTEAEVLQTPRMVALDWRRSVIPPAALACLRHLLVTGLTAKAKFVSATKMGFPHVAPYTAAFRVVFNVPAAGRSVDYDFILFDRGRTEVVMSAGDAALSGTALQAREIRLARIVASRLHRD